MEKMINIHKDKYFYQMYQKMIQEIIDTGYLDIPQDEKEINHLLPFTPIHHLNFSDKKENVVLLISGAFNPIHDGHTNVLIQAKKHFESKNINVVGAYISPDHQNYVESKKKIDLIIIQKKNVLIYVKKK